MVPEGWKHLRLSEISSTVTSGSRDWAQYYADTGAKFIRMTNLRRGSIWLDLSDLKFVNIQSDSSDGKRTSLQTGDILMSITAELGKIGWVHQGLGEAYINQHTALIRLKENKSSSMFVAYLLSSQEMNSKINRLNDSGAKAGLNLPTIRSIPLNLPPLPEQKKIAQILSTWDKAITTTEQLLANSQQQKKALMQQLLTGKKRLLDKNGVRFSGMWKVAKLDEVCRMQAGKFVKAEEILDRNIDETYPCYGGNGLRGYTKTYTHSGTYSLIGRQGALCGNITLASGKFHATEHAIVVTPTELVHTKWLYYKLIDLNLNQYATGVAQPGLSVKNLEKVAIDFPGDISEQRIIAAALTNADNEIELLSKQLVNLKQEKKALMQQLLTGKRRVNHG